MDHRTADDLKVYLDWKGPIPLRWTKGLSNAEIDTIAQAIDIGSWQGIGLRDNTLQMKVKMKYNEPHPSSFILNSAKLDAPGQHWIAVYYNINNVNPCEYFDSTGLSVFYPELVALWERLSPWKSIKVNHKKIQNPADRNSISCGYHALFYLYAKCKYDWCTAENVWKCYSLEDVTSKAHKAKLNHPHVNDLIAMLAIEKFLQVKKIKL